MKEEMVNIKQVINTAKQRYGLHQLSEIEPCMEFLVSKNLDGFVEIGSANGGSFHCWASIIPDGPKVSVDWNRGFGMSPDGMAQMVAPEEEFATVQKRNEKWREDFDDVRIVEGDCLLLETLDKCRKVLNDDLVDWLFIDATHEYKPALIDFNNYKQFVRSGGYIGFHDVHSHEEMRPLWSHLKQKYSMAAEFLHGHGIGILQMD